MILRGLAALFLLLLLGGCGGGEPRVLRFGLAQAPVTLDPRHAGDAAAERINRLIYASLVGFDATGRPVPRLATWERLTPTRYRFHLGGRFRTFHDGRRLESVDVKATYDYLLDPANASPQRLSLSLIAAVETPDPETVEFRLSRPDPLFPAYLATGIVPRDATGLATRPVGSGPFAFEAWPEEGRLRLRRLRDGLAVEFVTVRDPTVRVLKLARGEIDLLQNDLPPELGDWLARREGIAVTRGPGSNFTYLGFNLEAEPTRDPRVRRAVALAVDREAIIRHLLPGARPASALLPPEHWAGNADLPLIAHDPQAARHLLAAAGYGPDHPLRLAYRTSTDPFRVRLATVLQDQFARAGIEVTLRSNEWGVFFGDIKAGRFQMFSLTWVGIRTPDIFRYAFHSASLPPSGANRGRLRSAEVDRLIEAAEGEVELGGQARHYRRLQARLLEELPYVPLWYEAQLVAARAGVSGYRLALDGNYDGLEDVRLEGRP